MGEIDLIRVLRSRSTICVVAELDGSVEGFAVYDLLPKMIRLVNFAVCPTIRRRGIGSAMLSKLVAKLTPGRRSRLEATVRETNLGAQKVFASQGFRAVRVVAGATTTPKNRATSFATRLPPPGLASVISA